MSTHTELGDELYTALRERKVVAPLTSRVDGITIDDAYEVSKRILARRTEDGETLVGKKIGVTSLAVQSMLGVYQPDFGYLTSAMWIKGDEIPVSTHLIQPRAEGEIAFVLGRDLVGPGITNEDVLAAADHAVVCFEIVDSRIADWKIKIEDTVADNASSGLFVVGEEKVSVKGFDFFSCGMVVEKNGKILSTGAGAAALGSPLTCVAWLANTLGKYGVPLRAGEIILSGSLVPLEKVSQGDAMKVTLGGGGSLSVRFT